MVQDMFTRIRAHIMALGGYSKVGADPALIRQIANDNKTTITAVRHTLSEMKQEHRDARRIRDALLRHLPPDQALRLRQIKIGLLNATADAPQLDPTSGFAVLVAGTGSDDDPLSVGLIPPGQRQPVEWYDLHDLLMLARLANLE